MIAPLGALIGYIYEIKFFKYSTKIPYILSLIEIILENILAKKINQISFLFFGRFLIRISNLRTHNKMYIINYLSKKDTNFYLAIFHGASILGSFAEFFINIFYDWETFDNLQINIILIEKTLGSFINLFLSIVFLIIVIVCFSEAKSKTFNKMALKKQDKKIKGDESLNVKWISEKLYL